jgi:hypothetical protein
MSYVYTSLEIWVYHDIDHTYSNASENFAGCEKSITHFSVVEVSAVRDSLLFKLPREAQIRHCLSTFL